MNKSRINRALDNIDELIAVCEQELRDDARVQPARESLSYIKHILEQYGYACKHIEDVIERNDEIHDSLRCISHEINREPMHIPLSLGP